ncbi:phage virion morphogenesis protein [Sphaerotilus sp.]|uniref:phage virion morphogenesis protein n=1 Tax=Sphaerotilus sp. TaxID=2093942 RepID=UPI00286DEDEA|nr:phage virion morphogenesis protein [Sphaerotilus sp.]
MATLTINIDGDGNIARRLDEVISALSHPMPMMAAIGARIEANINLRFETKTDPSGAPWAPISPLTSQFYALGGAGDPGAGKPSKERWGAFRKGELQAELPGSLLERTRLMRQSLAHNPADFSVEIGMSRATPGGKWQIPMLHEFGTRSMPRRGLLTADPETGQLGTEDEADVLAEIEDYLSGVL